jgi:tRNA(Ile)-lysidine synthase
VSKPKAHFFRESKRFCTTERVVEQKIVPAPIVMTKVDIGDQSKPITADEFEDIMNALDLKIAPNSKIVIGLSGGADSIALTLLLHEYCKKRNVILHTATVDHKLRTEAKTEAKLVNEWMAKLGIQHHVLELKWQDAPPQSHIQELARRKRYELLHNVCVKLGASYLFTAHHSNDQVETFLLRLAHYSNSDGLAGMYRIKKFMDITVVRPLLSLSKERAIATCMASNQPWVEDPSNDSEKYHRSRIRQSLALLAPTVPTDRFLSIISDFRKLRDFYHNKVEAFISKYVTAYPEFGYVAFNSKDYATLDFSTAYRVLVRLTLHIGGRDYASSFKALRGLHLDILAKEKPVSQTLGICWIHSPEQLAKPTTVRDAMGLSDEQNQLGPEKKAKEGKMIYISRQPSVDTKEPLAINGVTDYMGYWRITVDTKNTNVKELYAVCGPLNEKMKQILTSSNRYKRLRTKDRVPYKAILGLPLIIDQDKNLVAAPHYNIFLRKDMRIQISPMPKHVLILGNIEKN